MNFSNAIVLFGVFCGSSTHAQTLEPKSPATPRGILFEKDIQYRKGHERWVLNVIRSSEISAEPQAAIVLVHGGGWSGGDQYRFSNMGFELAKKGYVVILPTYRMIQDGPFPACLNDVKNAIRWARAHAKEYNIDPSRIGAYGNSAGGTLVLTAALTTKESGIPEEGSFLQYSSSLQSVVCSGAVGNMLHPNHSQRAKAVYRNLAGARNRDLSLEQIETVMQTASPSSYVRKEVPPILLVHGGKDDVVFIDSTDEFFKSMKSAGANIQYLRFQDAGHAVMGQMKRKTTPAMHLFFQKHLKQSESQY